MQKSLEAGIKEGAGKVPTQSLCSYFQGPEATLESVEVQAGCIICGTGHTADLVTHCSLSEPLPGTSSHSLSLVPSTQLTLVYSPVSGRTKHLVPKHQSLPSGPHQAGEAPPSEGQLLKSTVPFASHVKGRCRLLFACYHHTTLMEPPLR